MNPALLPIFPASVNNEFKGHPSAKWLFLIITIITILRSCIHIFLPDGGASIIAGIDTTGPNGNTIIALFALWGLSQLLLGLVFLLIFFRYKSLIAVGYLLILLEYTLRIILGLMKSIESTHVPPGVIGNYVMVPLAGIFFYLSMKPSPQK